MKKIKQGLYKFMYGRYGHDTLNYFIIICAMGLSIISAIFFRGNHVVSLFVYALLILSMFRMMSRKRWKRKKENEKFFKLIRPIRSQYKLVKNNITDKDNRYYQCPQCGQKVRVPRGRGKIEISCPNCRTKFTRRS
jgi:DNA-directed RNA polymerase subunit RPC12/RpoP